MRRRVALVLIAIMTLETAGCSVSKNGAQNLELVSPLTKQEVLDFYAASMKYNDVISRNTDDIDNIASSYVEYKVNEETSKAMQEYYKEVEGVLGNNEYPEGIDSDIITEETFDSLKAQLNDISLSSPSVVGVSEALGNYFVDVEYKTSKIDSGTIKSIASLVGLNGAFAENVVTHEIYKNDAFLQAVVNSMNKYFELNGMAKVVNYDDENTFQILDGDPSNGGTVDSSSDENIDGATETDITEDTELDDTELDNTDSADTSESDNNSVNENDISGFQTSSIEKKEAPVVSAANTEEPAEEENNTEEQKESKTKADSLDDILSDLKNKDLKTDYTEAENSDRKAKFDIQYFNRIVGSLATQGSLMPKLSTVYDIPANSGVISGVAIYPTGNDGLKTFGYDRGKDKDGKMTLRYVFKLNDDGKVIGTNVYIKKYKADINIDSSDEYTNIPEYMLQEISNTIERADRVISNYDLPGMIQNNLFNDLGFGLLRGYLNSGARVISCNSEVEQIISRDIASNSYLVAVNTAFRVGSRSADSYATYKDKSYVVVRQNGTSFQITDWLPISKKIDTEPDIDVENSSIKRLVAMNLSGEVSDKQKESANKLLDELYKASTYRILNGPQEVETENGKITLEKGMYDCFNSDTELLNSDEKETINARIRAYLTGKGTDVGAEYIGSVTEWIGGSSRQVEFIAEELIKYNGMDDGIHLTTYYLMSNINDKWCIDELKYIDSEEVTGEEVNNIYKRITKEN